MGTESKKDLKQQIVELELELAKAKSAERLLSVEKVKFQSLVTNLPCIIYRYNCQDTWNMSYVSDSIEEISGYPASDFIDKNRRTFLSVIHPDDRMKVEEHVYAGLEQKRSFTIEYRLVDANGDTHWVYERGRGIFNENDTVCWLDGVIFDVTETKQLEIEKEELIADLQDALAEVRTLSGLLPICASCKKIRDDQVYWNQIESYISKHTETTFSHGICEDCAEKLYGTEGWFKKNRP